MDKPKHVHKYLICLTEKAMADLKWVTGYMQVSQSEAIRCGLDLLATQVVENAEKKSRGLAVLDTKANAQAKSAERKRGRAR